MTMDNETLKNELQDLLGPKGWLDGDGPNDDIEPFITEWRGFWRGSCIGVAKPASTEEVAKIVTLCAQAATPISVIGGNTGLVGGGVPGGGIVLSTARLNTIRSMDPDNLTMTVEAGCILAHIQDTAKQAGMLFPLSMASQGSCQIGGNLSTNAGGVAVLRYGNARDLVLGLEVVLPSGEIWNNLKALRKDNTGYDLKHLFMGAEGTLGIITAAVLKLSPQPLARETALIALPDVEAALKAFTALRGACYDALTAFEIISQSALELVEKHIAGTKGLFTQTHPYYALVELTSTRPMDSLRDILLGCLEPALESGIISDALIAENESQATSFWHIRESIPQAQVLEGPSIKHDISVPISAIPVFMTRAKQAILQIQPDVRIIAFGHMGDGNLHYNLSQPIAMDDHEFRAMWDDFNRIVHDIVMDMDGSFSAEHGIGQLKRRDLARYASPVEIELMRSVKSVLDPQNIMNPGKVIPDPIDKKTRLMP